MRIATRKNNNNRRRTFSRFCKITPQVEKTCNSNSTANHPDENPATISTLSQCIELKTRILPVAPADEPKSNSMPNQNPTSSSRAKQEVEKKTKPGTETNPQPQDAKKLQSRVAKKNSKSKNVEIKVNKSQNQNRNEEQTEDDSTVTFQDMKFNFWVLKFHTVIKILPTEFDVRSGVLKINTNKSKVLKYLDKFLFVFWQIYTILRILNLIWIAVPLIPRLGKSHSTFEIVRNFTITLVTGGSTAVYFGYIQITAFNMPSLNPLLNSLVKNLQNKPHKNTSDNENEGNDNSKWNQRFRIAKLIKSISRRPIRVNLLIYLPLFIYTMMFVVHGNLFVDPEDPIFWASFCLGSNIIGIRRFFCPFLLIFDLIFYFFAISQFYIGIFSMFLFMVSTEEEIEDAIKISRSRGGLEKAKLRLQTIKLQILLFNRVFSNFVYLTKLVTLAGAIIGGAGVIKFFPEPLLVVGGGLLYLESTVGYVILFNKVYMITDKVEELKQKILEKAKHPKQNVKVKDEYKRVCQSVQILGVQSGGFYLIERENTLNFMDFVVAQVQSLFLAFP